MQEVHDKGKIEKKSDKDGRGRKRENKNEIRRNKAKRIIKEYEKKNIQEVEEKGGRERKGR